MHFLNRESELNLLEKEYQEDRFSFVVVYGRRRVGKTRLLWEFAREKPSLIFTADTQTEVLNLRRMQEKAARDLQDELLSRVEFPSVEVLIKHLFQARGSQEKFILVIDEFQYLVQQNASLPSILQRLIDEELQATNHMLILCGSLVSLMYRSTLAYDSPLYGRRTSQIKLRPLRFDPFTAWCPEQKPSSQVELYGLLSGIPKYMELFSIQNSPLQSIEHNFLHSGSFFLQEPRFLLNEEISEGKTYFSILQVIAQGEHKIGKIASKVGLKNANITSFLNRLQDMDIIERRVPVFETRPEKSKKGLYFFKDHFFRFWFAYIFPLSVDIEMGWTDEVCRRIEETFGMFIAPVFEQVCQETVLKQRLFPVHRIGRYWSSRLEIDVVAVGEQDVFFGECKWSNQRVGPEILDQLQSKIASLDTQYVAGKRLHYGLFAKAGFTPELERIGAREDILLMKWN